MKPNAGSARVLIATDSADDARQIMRQLENDFDNVRASTDPERAVEDFEDFKPEVLMLAFDTMDKAQRYYLGLYRLGHNSAQVSHRTVILCTKDEVNEVFELCKKQYFDDYVLYWPHTYDGPRLAMSIWNAYRDITQSKAESPLPAELLAHAKHLGDLEKTLTREFAEGAQQVASARKSLAQAEQQIAGALDEFSQRMVGDGASSWVKIKDTNALTREIDQLKKRQVGHARTMSASGIEPMNTWANTLQTKVAPALAGTRPLTHAIGKIRPLVMVVEDDELIRALVSRVIAADVYEVIFAVTGTEALSKLRHAQPDLILLDIGLPGMDGLSLIARLKATPYLAKIPIVMMTGDARKETLVSSMKAGASDFVVKPFTRDALIGKLERFLPRGK